jgi:hypothetical protein
LPSAGTKQGSVFAHRWKDFQGIAGVSQQNLKIVTDSISGLQLVPQVKAIVRAVFADGSLSFQLVEENLQISQSLSLRRFHERVKRLRRCLLMQFSSNQLPPKQDGK